MLGPFPTTAHLPQLHISCFGVIPKGHNTGKFRLITDLFHPTGQSVNNDIDPDLCSLTYTKVEQVAATTAQRGQGALLAKVDIEAAYRLVPVHPQDRRTGGQDTASCQVERPNLCGPDAPVRVMIGLQDI